MKYLEQKIEELEKEVNFLKAKFKLQETKTDTSHYLNNYPPSPDWRNKEIDDYMYNPSINLLSEPDLETTFASPWDTSEVVSLSSTISDNLFHNPDTVNSFDAPYYHPDYPNIIGSWDDCDWDTSKVPPYPGHEITENVTDEYGFNMNYEEPITTWGFVSKYDKMDKDFLKNSLELKIEKDLGKIISKFRILNHEWEMDGYGYIVNNGIDNIIVTTNHGKIIVVDKDYLNLKLKEYKESIQETERALFLIK